MTDTERLVNVLAPSAQRLVDVARRLQWSTAHLITIIAQVKPEQIELLKMGGCGCTRMRIGDEDYSHIARKT